LAGGCDLRRCRGVLPKPVRPHHRGPRRLQAGCGPVCGHAPPAHRPDRDPVAAQEDDLPSTRTVRPEELGEGADARGVRQRGAEYLMYDADYIRSAMPFIFEPGETPARET